METSLLGNTVGTDPNLNFFTTELDGLSAPREMYLQTSPEFAMKRLLAAGSGSIFQICKAFRNGESGRCHNPEFTILEWYRVGFNLQRLMDETEATNCACKLEHVFSDEALERLDRFNDFYSNQQQQVS